MVLKRFCLVIGVDYPDVGVAAGLERRRKFSGDAKEIALLLADPASEVQIVDGPVTTSNLRLQIEQSISADYSDRDVIIYFAGHAERAGASTFLVTSDGTPGALGVDLDWILKQINATSFPSKIAIILDCCYSGCPGTPERGRFWLAACNPSAQSTDDFHSALVGCLSGARSKDLDLEGLYSCIKGNATLCFPELSGTLGVPFELRSSQPRGTETWKDIAEASLAEHGRLRTAFPTDLSFNELYEEGLYIEPRLLTPHRRDESATLTREDIVMKVQEGSRFLVLGEPGSGKSFFSYLCQRDLFSDDCNAVVMHAPDLAGLGNGEQSDRILSVMREASGMMGVGSANDHPVFLIDGLDETLSDDTDCDSVQNILTALSRTQGLIVFCRKTEYENSLFNIISSSNFDQILTISDWRLEVEFAAYVELLANRGYPNLRLLNSLINSRKELQELVTRPLHARMLSFIWTNDQSIPSDMPQNIATLYQTYLEGFARVCGGKLTLNGIAPAAASFLTILKTWRDFSWAVFERGSFAGGRISKAAYESLVGSLAPTARRAVRTILQDLPAGASSYLHYSFYEFLVADAFVHRLLTAFRESDPRAAGLLFLRDMTHEIRYYAARILRTETATSNLEFSIFLAEVYRGLRESATSESQRMTSSNLVSYLLGRTGPFGAARIVDNLLAEEANLFLKTSLYWAACHLGDGSLFRDYCTLLDNEVSYGSLNRGYLMYYYGDIDRRLAPPYHDDDPAAAWAKTRDKTMAMLRESDYQSKPACRQVIDIVTFLSFLEFHGQKLSALEHTVLSSIVTNIDSRSIATEVRSLQGRLAKLAIDLEA